MKVRRFIPVLLVAGFLPSVNSVFAIPQEAKPRTVPHDEKTKSDLLPRETVEEFEYVVDDDKKRTGRRRVLAVDLGGEVKLEFVRIEAGEFDMGAPGGEQDAEKDEKPQRRVKITKPFYLGKYEVTEAQYRAVVGSVPRDLDDRLFLHRWLVEKVNFDKLPVVRVTWADAAAFCKGAAAKSGRAVSLPTEAEWEYACRAGTVTPFHFGRKLDDTQASYRGSRSNGPVEVGSYKANTWGLHDMHGNVWEWCRDFYGPYEKVAGSGDPFQSREDHGPNPVLRGGSWSYEAKFCRSAYRGRSTAGNRYDDIGFRVCLRIE